MLVELPRQTNVMAWSGYVCLTRWYDADEDGNPHTLRYAAGAPVFTREFEEMVRAGVPMAKIDHTDGPAIRAAVAKYAADGTGAADIELPEPQAATGDAESKDATSEPPAEDKAVRGPREGEKKPARKPRTRKPAAKTAPK